MYMSYEIRTKYNTKKAHASKKMPLNWVYCKKCDWCRRRKVADGRVVYGTVGHERHTTLGMGTCRWTTSGKPSATFDLSTTERCPLVHRSYINKKNKIPHYSWESARMMRYIKGQMCGGGCLGKCLHRSGWKKKERAGQRGFNYSREPTVK